MEEEMAQQRPMTETVPRITLEEARARWEQRDNVVFVDVRHAEEYGAGHIPGARFIELRDIIRRADELPADAEIITY